MNADRLRSLLAGIEILRAPRRRLATFGATRIEYHLISPLAGTPARTRLREGSVVSERPKILTPEAFQERFEGFGDDDAEFARWANTAYRDLLRALEYNFRNQGLAAREVGEDARLVAENLLKDLDARDQTERAVIRCPDAGWSLALMKFTLDEASRSFPTHLRDLERRGAFAPDGGELERRRRKVEAMFPTAARDPRARDELGRRLREWGLFEEYEDRFLSLFA